MTRVLLEPSVCGLIPNGPRIVEDGKILTAAGVSAGIDLALALCAQLADRVTAESIQLTIEYDPQPPFAAGNPKNASKEVLAASLHSLKRIIDMEKARNASLPLH